MQLLVFMLVNLVIFGFYYKRVALGKKLAWLFAILAVMAALMYAVPGTRSRIKDTINELISFNGMVNNKQTNPRKFLWEGGLEVCRDNFWVGTGTGSADAALQIKIKDVNAKFWDGRHSFYLRDRNYNFHNAYLQHWAAHGLIGFLLLLGLFIIPLFSTAITVEGRIFLLVCAVSFLTESMLERQAGVLFFSFFYTLFFVLKPIREKL